MTPPAVRAYARPRGRWSGAFGQRFFIALVLGLLWIGPAWRDLRFLYAMAAWDAAAFALWAADFRRLPPPGAIAVSRRWIDEPQLRVRSQVVLEIMQSGGVPIRVRLTDDLAQCLRDEIPQVETEVPARGTSCAKYEIAPAARGDHELRRTYLRYQSAWQFAERWAVAVLEQRVRVYPNLQIAGRQGIYPTRRHESEMEKRARRQRGRGHEFDSLRDYREGDELRDICWMASARRGSLITKTYRAERNQGVVIVVDAGRLMLARTGAAPGAEIKLDCAVDAALSLAQTALHSGDSVGLLAYGRRIQSWLPPARNQAALRPLLNQLALVRGEMTEPAHAHAADYRLSTVKRRVLVVWLTDLAETAATPEVIEAAKRLAPKHLVLFVAIAQPLLRDAASRKPESPEEMYRNAVALDTLAHRAVVLGQLRQRGVLAAELTPGALAAGVVNQYLEVKERGSL